MRIPRKSRLISAAFLSLGVYGFASTLTVSAPQKVDFADDIQPILRAHCYRCHGSDGKAGGLALDSHGGILKGGVSGAAVLPGKGGQSLLISRLQGKLGKPQMPMGSAPLTDSDVAKIAAWIDQGCKDTPKSERVHWAYVKPVRPAVPKVKNQGWVRNPIDAFVLARLEKEGLNPSPEADKTTLIRRLSLDLTGLPPTPAEVDSFVADHSKDAYEKLVDRLFASPHYGERMALPWLDAARYADSNGFQQDGDTFQYVWRDWVVNAMNANMPFDQFTIEQLAGDELPDATIATKKGRDELIASGFNRDTMLNGEGGAIAEEQRNVILFDRVDTTATTWLGITMMCCRCHDHKYDPFTQKDYYSMLAFFNNVPETGVPEGDGQYRIAPPWIYAGTDDQMAKMEALEPQVAIAKEKAESFGKSKDSAAEQARKKAQDLQKQLDQLQASIPRVMVMSDRQPRVSHIYSRGNYLAPLAKVTCGTPATLPPMTKSEPKDRLGLAEWIVSTDNPLTARVQVNRYWQLFFGKGLVRTPENFGVLGEKPTHPELLDWLAVEFRESGWNVKRIQKLIVMSATYRQSSKASKALEARDPENRLLARAGRFRLPSMLIRDGALAASGLLNPEMGGKPVYPYQPKGIWDGLAITDERDFTYPQSKGKDLYRRSLYTFWRRTVAPGDMFDASARQVCTVGFSQTSTPMHALTTMNDVVWTEAGRVLGEHVMHEKATPEARLSEAFRRACARRPSQPELAILLRTLSRAKVAFAKDPASARLYLSQGESKPDASLDQVELAAYATVCSAILNLDEALTRE